MIVPLVTSYLNTYETVKYINIRDSRLGTLRCMLLLGIVIYVAVFEMWAQGGYLEKNPIRGVVRFSLQQPTVKDCDPIKDEGCVNAFLPLDRLEYCQQSEQQGGNYKGGVLPCQIYEATNAQIVSEQSIAIMTRVSTIKQELVCHSTDMVCPRTYNNTSDEDRFYIAQSEAFTILVDHSVTAAKVCERRQNYACSSESSKYNGRLFSKSTNLCEREFSRGNAFQSFRGMHHKKGAPCYIQPNKTTSMQDFFSLDALLQAVNVDLDDCNVALSENDECKTYRETGATILLNIYWSDFHAYHGMVEPYYYYAPQFLAGSSFKQNIPFYETYRQSRTLLNGHGVRVAVLLTGDYNEFNVVQFAITLTTALGLLAIATTVVDALMLHILPEKERYLRAKYEEENSSDSDSTAQPAPQLEQSATIGETQLSEPLLARSTSLEIDHA